MARIELDPVAKDIIVQSEYREKDLVKQVPGTRWDSDKRVWRARLSWATCIAFRGVFGDDLEIGPRLFSWAADERRWIDSALELRYNMTGVETIFDNDDLYPYQQAGVAFLTTAQQALIADEMGAGKTVQLIRTLKELDYVSQDNDGYSPWPVLVVAPNSVKYTWASEFEKWLPEARTIVIDGGAATRRRQLEQITNEEADVAIINWEALRLHSRMEGYGNMRLRRCEEHGGMDPKVKAGSCEVHPKELNEIGWGTVIADEAHKAKNPKAKQTRSLWAIAKDAHYRFAATGTPIANQPDDLWSIMRFISPDDFPGKTAFVDRYCMTSWNAFGGLDIVGLNPGTEQEFRRIVDPRMIRRLKEAVLPHLPPKTYVTRYVDMSGKQAKAYKEMETNMLALLEDGNFVTATNPLTQLIRLSQFSCAYSELDTDGNVHLSEPSNKIDVMMDVLEEAGNEQVVVFAESRQLIELAEARCSKEGITYGSIHGNVSVEDRAKAVEAFQAGKLRVMLATMGAGGEGITLTAASIALFLQRSWSMIKNKQAEDRIHRPGQDANKVEIIDLITRNTVEERRVLQLQDKEDRLEQVVQDADTLRKLLGG